MPLIRSLQHLLTPPWHVRRCFPTTTLDRITAAIGESEATHHGQIAFAVEAALELRPLWRRQSARERALEVFGQLRVWDTEHNNGVLIYVLLADHDVEIIADRGIHRRVEPAAWEQACRAMEQAFRAGRYEAGALTGIRTVGALLAQHYPGPGGAGNEVADQPTLLDR